MIGAIIGDIVGSRFERAAYKSKEFDLFGNDRIERPRCAYTDDTVMTVAVADALLRLDSIQDDDEFFRLQTSIGAV